MTNAVNIAGLGAALTVSSNIVNFSSTPTVSGSPIGASAATPTALGTVYGKTTPGSGTENCALGYQSLNVATGSKNCALGTYSGFQITSGIQNTLVGSNSGAGMTTGSYNSGVGYIALSATTTGNENTALGYGAGTSNTTGAENVAIGSSALFNNSTGNNNVAVGRRALYNTTGTGNVAIGESTGNSLAAGSYNIYIGYQTGNATKTSGVDCIYIGRTITPNNAGVNGELVINTNGNNQTGRGDGTGLISTGGSIYQQNNSSSWATTSDRRLKKNIVDNTEGLDVISQIRVRNFEYRLPEEITELKSQDAVQKSGVQLGVVAQELQEVCSDCVKEESTGVLSVDTSNLTWHMVNAIKDLKAELDTVKAELAALKG
jgi:hypothetical protein